MSQVTQHPNVVLILADNLGWGELGCYGGGAIRGAPTPRIDALAAQGTQFLNFNVESDCVPTRSALMTGRHPVRTGAMQSVPAGLPQGLVPWERTLAQAFSEQGYATAMYGKWHLGDKEGRYPRTAASTSGTGSRAPPTKACSWRRWASTPTWWKCRTSWRAARAVRPKGANATTWKCAAASTRCSRSAAASSSAATRARPRSSSTCR